MEIYIEDTIFVNFLTSYIICKLTLKCLKFQLKHIRFWLCILLSVLSSVLSVYIKLPNAIYLALKLALGFILSVILCPKSKLKTIITCFLTFMLNTFLMGGICYAIIGLSGKNIQLNTNQASANITVGVVLLGSIIYYIALKKLLKVFYSKKKINNYCYQVILQINNVSKNITGFLDTGNNLKYNNLPISIIPFNLAAQFDKNLNLISLLSQKPVIFNQSCYIKYSTVSGQGNMLIFKPDKFQIKVGNNYFDFSNSYIGISLTEISSTQSYSVLINSQLI